jgi:hypothetical protein
MVSILMVLSLVFISPNQVSDYKVFITKNRYEADLWVWKSENRYESKEREEFWTEVNSKYQADFTIRFVRSKYQADLIIYYTDSKYQAGWKNKNHRLKNIMKVK